MLKLCFKKVLFVLLFLTLNVRSLPYALSTALIQISKIFVEVKTVDWLLTATNRFEVVRLRVLDTAIDDHATCGNDYVEARDGEIFCMISLK